MAANELLSYVGGEDTPALARPLARWMESSPRFEAFVAANRDKIRKKLRGLRDDDGSRDLLAELAVAHLLLLDPRNTVAFEKRGEAGRGGPDFAVTFRTRIGFNVEVTRLRASGDARHDEPDASQKLGARICAKVGQLPPSAINVLALVLDGPRLGTVEVASVMRLLKARAERKDDAFFVRRGLADARDFLRRYTRLSGVAALGAGGGDEGVALWVNRAAKHPLPPEVGLALRRWRPAELGLETDPTETDRGGVTGG